MAAPTLSLQLVRKAWEKMVISGRNFYRVLNKVNIVSVSPGRCCYELIVEEEHTNGRGALHGGYMTTMVDTLTAVALATTEVGRLGASVTLNMSFLRSVDIGERVSIEAEVIKAGKSLAFTKADLFNSNGDLIAQGQHTIFVGKRKTAQDLEFNRK